jgi:PPOX class probable F420-dependent enzyme
MRSLYAHFGHDKMFHVEHFSILQRLSYNMPMAIPREIEGQKYASLTTFRKNGVAVSTPVWFGEDGGKLYVMSNHDAGKCKRIRNNPKVKVAPCTVRGKITGPEFEATARILPPEESPRGRAAVRRKYWLARMPWWRKSNVYLEIEVAQ